MSRLRLSIAVAVLTAVSACSPPKRPDIVLIVIDALRADRVDFSEPQHELTPFLASLAQRGAVFWNAYAQSSRTPASMASLWTSRYPSQHGVRDFTSALPQGEETLAENLKQAGYLTAGFSANVTLSHDAGFARGFDRYEAAVPTQAHNRKQSARSLIKTALNWLDSVPLPRQAPVFLYLHLMEPHFPYLPPKPSFDQILSRRPDAQRERQVVYDMFFIHPERWHQTDDATMATLRDLYDGEVLEVDTALRELFAELDKRGLRTNAVVVVTADHGEAFLEHGHTQHGNTLYNEEAHVPLLLLSPGASNRIDIRDPVGLIDVAPTLLDLAAVPVPAAFAGHSLRPSVQHRTILPGGGTPQAAVYSELFGPDPAVAPWRALILGQHKLIVRADGTSEVYDLTADPNEAQSHAPADGAGALMESLDRVRAQLPQPPAVAPTVALSEVMRQRLQALGYN